MLAGRATAGMSVRRHLVAPSLALAAVAGLLRLNGFRVLSDLFGVGRTPATIAVAVQVLAFAVGVLGPAAVGYRAGTRADLREDYAALAVVVGLAAFAGFAVAAGATVLVADPMRFRIRPSSAAVFLLAEPAKFALYALAGAAVGYFRAVRAGVHGEVGAA